MQSKTPGGVELLKTLSLQTGQTRPLVASNQVLQNSTTVPYLTNYAAPYYSSATHQLVFTATNGNGRSDVWIATVIFGKDGWPTLSTSPTSLMPCDASCGNILTWSPSGEWLIFKGKDGLYAINISTHHQQRITSSPGDKWPACSPDGTWLAYQSVYNTIEAVPSKDCLPIPDTAIPKRFVNNINYSWKPGWSADGKKVTFLSNIAGENEVFYEIAFRDMSPYNPDSPILYSHASPPSCTSITWMHRQSSQQEIAIFACKGSKQENETFGSYLLIEPDVLQPDWKVILNAGTMYGIGWIGYLRQPVAR